MACLEYCDAGTLLEAAHGGAFRPPGSSVLSGAVRPALVPLYMSLLEVREVRVWWRSWVG